MRCFRRTVVRILRLPTPSSASATASCADSWNRSRRYGVYGCGHRPGGAEQEGLSGSFEAFYERHRPTVVRAVAFSLGNNDVAAEAVDEASARAYERWSQVTRMPNPAGWVFRVAVNCGRSAAREQRIPHRSARPDVATAPEPKDPAVQAALDRFDVDHRIVVVCRYLLDWSEAETAAVLKLRPGTVKSRLSRASAQLRTALDRGDR